GFFLHASFMMQSTSLHVAIIMDGNGRWATRRGLPRAAGHRAGAQAVRRIVEAAPGLGARALTLFAFSADNWKRPPGEVAALMRLFARHLRTETPKLVERGVRLDVVGRRDRLPAPLVASIAAAERATRDGAELRLRLAVDYSARWAISVALGTAGGLRLRAPPRGLTALLCTVGLVAAAAWTARRRGTAVSGDAPWLAATALLLGSNFAARDSTFLRAFDAIGLAIVFSLAALSLQGVALRGRQAWEYVRAALAAAVSACVGVFLLVGREVAWTELPRRGGGRLPQARAAAVGALLALPLLLVFGGLFASADAVFRNLAVNLLDVDLAAATSHTFLAAFLTALAAGYLWGALLRPAPPPPPATSEASRFTLGIVPVGTALGLLDLLFILF